MSFMNDPGLKLFGKIIQVNSKDTNLNLSVDEDIRDFGDDTCHNKECTIFNDNLDKGANRGNFEETICEELKDKNPSKNQMRNSTLVEDGTLALNEKVCSSQYSHNKDGNDQTSSTDQNGQKQLKKPEKIRPCPRCNSMSTKFCYFNNYNVNQPRHFCKDCQRYWTAGGTMRNVPVGAGRRKSKSAVASQHRHLLVPRVASELRASSYNSYVSPLFFKNGGPVQVSCFRGLVGFPVSYSDQSVTTCCSPTSSTSRKHFRDGAMLNFSSSDGINKDVTWDGKSGNGRVVIPKTLKVVDPIETSNSSIWSTLRGKNSCNGSDSNAKGEFFGGLHKINNRSSEPLSMILDLNPAAFSRSLSFHEMAP